MIRALLVLVLVVACGGRKSDPAAPAPVANETPSAKPETIDDRVERFVAVLEEMADILDANRADCARAVTLAREHGMKNATAFQVFDELQDVPKAEQDRLQVRFGERFRLAVRMFSDEGPCAEGKDVLREVMTEAVSAGGAVKTVKAPEAVTNVRKIWEGARTYYEEGAGQFPVPTAPGGRLEAPPLGSCCLQPGNRCAPDPSLWNDPVWHALKFSMDDPHYYSYVYTATATEFSAAAHGDLDCDGVYSTFEMVGRVQPDGTVSGSAGLFRDQELE